jgi:hypothetical protein
MLCDAILCYAFTYTRFIVYCNTTERLQSVLLSYGRVVVSCSTGVCMYPNLAYTILRAQIVLYIVPHNLTRTSRIVHCTSYHYRTIATCAPVLRASGCVLHSRRVNALPACQGARGATRAFATSARGIAQPSCATVRTLVQLTTVRLAFVLSLLSCLLQK